MFSLFSIASMLGLPVLLYATGAISSDQLPMAFLFAVLASVAAWSLKALLRFALFGVIGAVGYAAVFGMDPGDMLRASSDFAHGIVTSAYDRYGDSLKSAAKDVANQWMGDGKGKAEDFGKGPEFGEPSDGKSSFSIRNLLGGREHTNQE